MPRWERGGVRTMEDIKARCELEVDGHLLWQGYMSKNRPTANLPGHGCVNGGARMVAIVLGKDHKRQPHQRWYMRCGQSRCMTPKCLTLGSHREALQSAAAAGAFDRAPDQIARQRLARRKRADFRPAWMVQWALESQQPAKDVAHALEVHPTTVKAWRAGRIRKDQVFGAFAAMSGLTNLSRAA